jgi:hypothetical protein
LPSWNTEISLDGPAKKKLRIGVMLTDDFFEASAACQRGVQIAADALKRRVPIF